MRLLLADVLLAQINDILPNQSGIERTAKHAFTGAAPVLIGALGLLAALIIWAVFFRKSEGRRERGRILDSEGVEPVELSHRSRRRRRRREKHRPRNPTLAEAGGLPPVRDEDSPPPPL